MRNPSGKQVFGRIVNTAINAAPVEIVWKDAEGVTHTLAATERVIINNIAVNNRATAKDVTIFHDTDSGADLDSGEEIIVFSFAAAGFNVWWADQGRPTKRLTAATQKFYAFASAAGSVDVFVDAEITNALT
jgi:hypothetical protein